MANPRPAKRLRTTGGPAYHAPLPSLDDYSLVHSSEGRLVRVGNGLKTAPLLRMPEHATGSWSRVSEWTLPDDAEFALDPTGDSYDEALEMDVMDEDGKPSASEANGKKRSKVSRRPHVVWKDQYRQVYLDEVLRWAGRGDFRSASQCPDCLARSAAPGVPAYWCEECIIPDLTCASCCVRRHRMHPFHRKWTGSHFAEVSLKSIGLKIQLNHGGAFCEKPIPCHTNFRVLHTNGIHEVDVRFCGCAKVIPVHLQLLRRGLYPASQLSIQTCATFTLLDQLHMLALTTKGSTYDFYRALEKLTDNTGINPPKSRYRALLRMVLQWRHLKLLKRGGPGHDSTGVAGTKAGELALRCPSCPIPGVNLPEGWEDAPEGMKFLYMMIICMDANFRLKNQLVSSYSQDPGLGIGWAYMVPRAGYEAYVLSRADDADISTCVGLQALAKANTKYSYGLRYTGVGLGACGRSEMILPLGVGNLQKGERYANMDYIFAMVMQWVLVALVLISYDIACQWFVNLFNRIEGHWPEEIKFPNTIQLRPAIPKLHEPMHQTKGHQVYSFNYIPGVGLTDGECPERVWGPHNALGNSTKTQGPGSRQDVLDDHFAFWNWLKYINMGYTLLRRYKAAVAQRNLQQEGHRGLTNSLDAELIEKWEKLCVEWEQDASFPKKKKNPYYNKDAYLSEAQVKKELAEEEERRLAQGGVSLHATSAWSFIQMGLDLEETQHRLKRLSKTNAGKLNITLGQERTLTEERNILRGRIRSWEKLLHIYLPGLLQYQTDLAKQTSPPTNAPPKSEHPEDFELWLPSYLPAAIEERLRDAQCSDSLEKIQRILKVKSRMIYFKNKNLRGQRDGTRSRTVIDRVHEKARHAADRYRSARRGKLALTGPGKWEETFRVLEDGDIRGYQDPNRLRPRVGRRGVLEDEQLAQAQPEPPESNGEGFELFNEQRSRRDGTGETRRTLSWIWQTVPISDADDDQDEILRVEWAKSRARAARAREEVLLLKEEMRRVLAFLQWKANWWTARLEPRDGLTKELEEGIRAYAQSQSKLQEDLATHFRALWKAPLEDGETAANRTGDAEAEVEDGEDGEEEEEEEEEEEFPIEPLSDDDDDP
ncbi:hypothetical protein GALMADRAFT_148720 [Galerina marginata CBS 339.88]|uniref:CxC2-like cysteine cluster KDZ transposase-associated domain-containing protein n=1 Tax=Galerina marginata (strain CBS 339.88) TaxID=685588 RepID=A0A067S6A1_GALM3|nr:hypothetical protein GALMADRAFT_148720 [Galerina marginata CBS 339.88]